VSAATQRYIREKLNDGLKLSRPARLLLLLLGNHANVEGIAWPSVDTLAREMDTHPTRVRRARAELVAAGVIEMIEGGGRGRSNLYVFPKPTLYGVGFGPRNPRPTAHKPTPHGSQTHAPAREGSIHEGSIEAPPLTAAEIDGLARHGPWFERFRSDGTTG